jgi:hypothetical protein
MYLRNYELFSLITSKIVGVIANSLGQFMQDFKKLNRVSAIPDCKRLEMFAHGLTILTVTFTVTLNPSSCSKFQSTA